MDILVRNYSGETLARRLDGDFNGLCEVAESHGAVMLGNVDPYDDTTFTKQQVSVLLTELSRLAGVLSDDQRRAAEEIVELAGLVELTPHRYLVFSGD